MYRQKYRHAARMGHMEIYKTFWSEKLEPRSQFGYGNHRKLDLKEMLV